MDKTCWTYNSISIQAVNFLSNQPLKDFLTLATFESFSTQFAFLCFYGLIFGLREGLHFQVYKIDKIKS